MPMPTLEDIYADMIVLVGPLTRERTVGDAMGEFRWEQFDAARETAIRKCLEGWRNYTIGELLRTFQWLSHQQEQREHEMRRRIRPAPASAKAEEE